MLSGDKVPRYDNFRSRVFRRAAHKFEQAPRILWRRAFLVVVEIDEDGAALPLPGADVACPGSQRLIRIPIAIAAGRAMPAQIHMTRRHLPWRWRVMMIRNTERNIARAQKLEDIVVIPAPVSRFECVEIAARQHLEERFQPLAILLEPRR